MTDIVPPTNPGGPCTITFSSGVCITDKRTMNLNNPPPAVVSITTQKVNQDKPPSLYPVTTLQVGQAVTHVDSNGTQVP